MALPRAWSLLSPAVCFPFWWVDTHWPEKYVFACETNYGHGSQYKVEICNRYIYFVHTSSAWRRLHISTQHIQCWLVLSFPGHSCSRHCLDIDSRTVGPHILGGGNILMCVSVVGQCYHSTDTSDSAQAFLITGLECGLEQWNGLWNGLRSFVYSRQHHISLHSSCFRPFLVRQTSKESPLLQLRLLATYRTCLSKLKYACELWPQRLWGGCMNVGQYKEEL